MDGGSRNNQAYNLSLLTTYDSIYRTTSEAITKNAIIAIILLILRSFQRKGLCNSGLKAKSTTFVRNITTIRLRSQFVILKMNINMTDITEKTENGKLVTNRDQLVVMDNIESLIKVIRGQHRYEREYRTSWKSQIPSTTPNGTNFYKINGFQVLIPRSKGGSNSTRNAQVLSKKQNGQKSNH